ncbi:hypothetical protein OA93_06065 [Flavobacterium sp. KMS]|uniref:O-antigen ligase family protein n=1 Tax=Flavobacterium sp. KMS TaxID=1566023 RepID=UPI00057F0C8C|nr:O-antigen ligase family protein [Flavobacterium sp. KMS]KIA99193.1 hypothetical protein OA93_06065 [Flavobacterium sp. KMS]
MNILQSANEYFKSTGLFFSPNHLGIYLALGFLTNIEILRKSKIMSIKTIFYIGLVILLYGLYLSECRGAYLGLSIALLFRQYNLNQKFKAYPKWKILLCSLTVLTGLFLIVKGNNSVKSESALGRLFIIKQSLEQIKEHPLSGHGINSFSLKYNSAKAQYFATERSWEDIKNASYIYSANNDFLELTFELGITWILIFIFFVIKLRTYSTQNTETQICSSILICLLIFTLTNSILSTPLFTIIACYCVVVIINSSEIKPIYTFNNNIFLQISFAIIGFIFLVIIFLRLNAEYRLLSYYNETKHLTSLKNIENYVSKIDANGEALFMAGGVLLKNKYAQEGTSYLAQGFKHSGKPSLGRILAGLYQKQGKYSEAEQIYKYNINIEPFRYEARMDLFRLYITTNQTKKSKEEALKIILLPIKIPSEKITEYKNEAEKYINEN